MKLNKTDNVRINVTAMRILVTVVAMESIKYFII